MMPSSTMTIHCRLRWFVHTNLYIRIFKRLKTTVPNKENYQNADGKLCGRRLALTILEFFYGIGLKCAEFKCYDTVLYDRFIIIEILCKLFTILNNVSLQNMAKSFFEPRNQRVNLLLLKTSRLCRQYGFNFSNETNWNLDINSIYISRIYTNFVQGRNVSCFCYFFRQFRRFDFLIFFLGY